MIDKPEFKSKQEEIEWVFKNKDLLMIEKKNERKFSDSFCYVGKQEDIKTANKAEGEGANSDPNSLKVELVINTTNIIDSHMDCHIDGIWNKSLKELGVLYLLQEHRMEFKSIIADSVKDGLKASAKTMTWSELGLEYKGNTQALIFNSNISKARNEFMFNQYKSGYVLNHSVGMRYIKLYLCVDNDNPEYTQEKESWDKYYPLVVNKEVADQRGYFWAVTEAKIVEGSAVVKGSNYATPTLSCEENKKIEAVNDTSKNEPLEDTQTGKTHLLLI